MVCFPFFHSQIQQCHCDCKHALQSCNFSSSWTYREGKATSAAQNHSRTAQKSFFLSRQIQTLDLLSSSWAGQRNQQGSLLNVLLVFRQVPPAFQAGLAQNWHTAHAKQEEGYEAGRENGKKLPATERC